MTIIKLKKFGEILISRPAGKEAWLAAIAYTLPKDAKEKIVVDFEDVKVLGPSWADEFLTPLKKKYSQVKYISIDNLAVKATLDFL